MVAAAILVGGLGTRLRSVIQDVPKPLAPVHGEPFLFLLLKALKQQGVQDVILLTGYLHDKIKEACGNGAKFGLSIQYAHEENLLGTAGALKNAQSFLSPFTEFLVLNGDSYCKEAIDVLSQTSLHKNQWGLVAVSFVEKAERFGTVDFDAEKHITAFKEKSKADSGFVNAGVYRLSHMTLDHIPKDTVYSLESQLFPALLQDTLYHLSAVVVDAHFDDIGLPESYFAFQEKTIATTR